MKKITIEKCVIENEVYLLYKGKLIYKKWLNTGRSVIFGLHGQVYHG